MIKTINKKIIYIALAAVTFLVTVFLASVGGGSTANAGTSVAGTALQSCDETDNQPSNHCHS